VIWDIQSSKQIKSILDAHQQALVTVKFIESKNRLLTADLKASNIYHNGNYLTGT